MKPHSALLDLDSLDLMAEGDSPVHRLDPRAKLASTLAFVVTVLSFDRYEISALLPFLFFPLLLLAAARLPAGPVFRKTLPVLPFALLVGIFNPLLDREILLHIGPFPLSGGWVSFASILLRVLLTASAALVLIAVTGFRAVCLALDRLGAPRIFVLQLLFLHRFLFVLVEEGGRMSRARASRSFGRRGLGVRETVSLLGHLLLRTLERAQRLHRAMLSRGFDGQIRLVHPMRFRGGDATFLLVSISFFILLRFWNLPRMAGGLLTEYLP